MDLPEAAREAGHTGRQGAHAGAIEALHLHVGVDLLLRALDFVRGARVEPRGREVAEAGAPGVIHVWKETVEQTEAHAPQPVDPVECDAEAEVGAGFIRHLR